MSELKVTVRDKIATAGDQKVVCGNSDYTVCFDLDAEWGSYETKTMRVVYHDHTYTDVVFTGIEAPLPVVVNQSAIRVGLFAGDLHTSSPAYFPCVPSILCGNASESKESQELKDNMNKILAEKVDVPQTASVGDVLTVEEVDANGKPTKWKAATKKQANWEQNDSTAEDYVQGRTHWVEHDVLTEILPETTVTIDIGDDDEASENVGSVEEPWSIGDRAVVKINDVGYDLTVAEDSEGYMCLGNLHFYDDTAADTGEFFQLYVDNGLVFAVNVSGTYTISVSFYRDVYHTINPKYIKDMYGEIQSIVDISKEFPDLSLTFEKSKVTDHGYVFPLALGQTWDIHATGGIEYNRTLEVKQADDGTLYIGNYEKQSGEPFYITSTQIYVMGSWIEQAGIQKVYLSGSSGYTTKTSTLLVPFKYLQTDEFGQYLASMRYSLSNQVYTVNVSSNTSKISVPSEAKLVLVRATSTTMSLKTISIGNGTSTPIWSYKTGKAITDSERPQNVMLLAIISNFVYCLNPI